MFVAILGHWPLKAALKATKKQHVSANVMRCGYNRLIAWEATHVDQSTGYDGSMDYQFMSKSNKDVRSVARESPLDPDMLQ